MSKNNIENIENKDSKDKRIGWLEELKVGDKVIVSKYNHSSVKHIDKITATGRINVDNVQFNYTGSEIGGDRWHRAYLMQWTQQEENEIKNKIQVKKMRDYLIKTNWETKTFDVLKEVYEFVKSKETQNNNIK